MSLFRNVDNTVHSSLPDNSGWPPFVVSFPKVKAHSKALQKHSIQ